MNVYPFLILEFMQIDELDENLDNLSTRDEAENNNLYKINI